MLSVEIEPGQGLEIAGESRYAYPSMDGVSEFPYTQDVWTCWLNKIAFRCTAWKRIISVGGYLPHQDWRNTEDIESPSAIPGASFIINEPFDELDRSFEVQCPVKVSFDARKRLVQVKFAAVGSGSRYVSPHRGLILGATETPQGLVLSDVLFTDVLAHGKEPGQPTPW